MSRWEQFDKNYLSKLLLRKSVYRKSELWEAYQKINIRDAISVIDQVRQAWSNQNWSMKTSKPSRPDYEKSVGKTQDATKFVSY